jgi:hypothetical protein
MVTEEDIASIKRRQAIAQMLMEQGQQDIPTQTAGGMVVPVSPLQGISRVAQMLSGAYIGNKADKESARIKQARMDALGSIDFNSPDAANQMAKNGLVEEAVKMRMSKAEKAQENRYQPTNMVVTDPDTGVKYLRRFGSLPGNEVTDTAPIPSDVQWLDTGSGFEPVAKQGVIPGTPGKAPISSPSQANNFNFGNLRPAGKSTGFQKFKSPEDGIAAIDRQLGLYGKRGIDTLQEIISTWAPPNENPTPQLIQNAAKRTGLDPNQPLDIKDPNVLVKLRNAIIQQEQSPSVASNIIKKYLTPAQQLENDVNQQANLSAAKAEAVLPAEQAKEQIKQGIELGTAKAKNQLEIEKTQNEKLAAIKYNAEQASPLLDSVIDLLPKTVSGGLDKGYNSAMEYLGVSTDRSKAQSQLDVIANDLTSKIPKAPGSQSDVELKYAQKQAGDLANPEKSWETRLSAAKYLKQRNEKILKGETVDPPKQNGWTVRKVK